MTEQASIAKPPLQAVRNVPLEEAVWLISDPHQPAGACETDVDALLNEALARVPYDGTVRIEVWCA